VEAVGGVAVGDRHAADGQRRQGHGPARPGNPDYSWVWCARVVERTQALGRTALVYRAAIEQRQAVRAGGTAPDNPRPEPPGAKRQAPAGRDKPRGRLAWSGGLAVERRS
jgi:hypothetical protein